MNTPQYHNESNYTILLRLLNGQIHTMWTNVQSQSQIPIYQGSRLRLLDDRDGFIRPEDALVDTITID